jgi:hypothetical protein
LALSLTRLGKALFERPASVATANNRSASDRPPQGQVLRMIKAVLAEHPDGLRVSEIRELVEQRLGRGLCRSTVKGALAEHAAPGGRRSSVDAEASIGLLDAQL